MESVTLLGVRQPVGLEYLINESILPQNPPAGSYSWETYHEDVDGLGEEELVTTDQCVVWSVAGTVRRFFRFDPEYQNIIQTILTWFNPEDSSFDSDTPIASFSTSFKPISPEQEHSFSNRAEQKATRRDDESPKIGFSDELHARRRALVIILKQQAHVYFLNGSSHVVHLPFEVEKAFPSTHGLLFQRKVSPRPASTLSPAPPPVPPNSFWASQSQSFYPTGSPAIATDERKGKASAKGKSGQINLADFVIQSPDSLLEELPRLFSLTDPLAEVGLVVENVSTSNFGRSSSSHTPNWTNSLPFGEAEQVLYFSSSDELTHPSDSGFRELLLLVSFNQELRSYTIWSAVYSKARKLSARSKKENTPSISTKSKRRSSFVPLTGRSTPTLRRSDVRESFGAGQSSLPASQTVNNKGGRTSESFSLDRGYDGDVNSQITGNLDFSDELNTGNRRVSSLVARAELAGHDQNTFTDMVRNPGATGNSFVGETNRGSSFRASQERGSFGRSRMSGRASTPGARSVLSDVDESLPQDTIDDASMEKLLEMADDLDLTGPSLQLDGLRHELVLTKVASLPAARLYPSSERLSLQQLRDVRVVTMRAHRGESGSDGTKRSLSLFLLNRSFGTVHEVNIRFRSAKMHTSSQRDSSISYYPFEVVLEESGNDVLDAAKIVDGNVSRVLFLHKPTADGQAQLRLQLATNDVHGLSNAKIDFTTNDQPQTIQSNFKELAHPGRFGKIDCVDNSGLHSQIQLRLRPRNVYVSKILDVCRYVILEHIPKAEAVYAIWFEVVQAKRLKTQFSEWQQVIITLFVLCSELIGIPSNSGSDSTHREPFHLASPKAWRSAGFLNNNSWSWTSTNGSRLLNKTFILDCANAAQRIVENWELAPDFEEISSDQKLIALQKILVALHLLREEQKLDITSQELCASDEERLTPVLAQIGQWLGWQSWGVKKESFYHLDDEAIDEFAFNTNRVESHLTSSAPFEPPSILDWIEHSIAGLSPIKPFPTIDQLKTGSGHWATFLEEYIWPVYQNTVNFVGPNFTPRTSAIVAFVKTFNEHNVNPSEAVEVLLAQHIDARFLETLPEGLVSLIRNCILEHQSDPSTHWTASILSVLGREDLNVLLDGNKESVGYHEATLNYEHLYPVKDVRSMFEAQSRPSRSAEVAGYFEGEKISQFIFRLDNRVEEVEKLLDPHAEALAEIYPTRGTTETAFLEEQKKLAQLVYKRTMAIPSGKAAHTFAMLSPLPSQKLETGTFNTSCRMQPSNVVVNADRSTFTEEKVCWAFFHGGVAAGLCVVRNAAAIDTSWLVLNRPPELGNRHAGLLLALGLNGNLKSIAKWLAFKYLTPKHSMTSIGLLLGLSASHLGTMDSLITRLLSVHVTRLLPQGAAELNLGRLTQTAGIMGVGLLYYNTQHRRMSEVMLSEIEHVEAEYTSESVPDFRDEGYRLAAGFALGLINLGKGRDLLALHDLRLVERLLSVATGSRDIDEVHVLDQATAAATMAIAMIFMKTGDSAIARKINVPSSAQQFDYVRPDVLLLRAVAKNLIMWNEIEATDRWIWTNLPTEYRERVDESAILKIVQKDPLNGRNLPFYNILAGLCWTISLKFAGTASSEVCNLLLRYYDFVSKILGSRCTTYDEYLTRDTLMKFLHLLGLSCATVQAGTGDLSVLRRLRVLHATVNSDSDFGHHQASHMALGILFLGNGRYTFNTSDLAVASLLIAFYPIFPKDVLDNSAHLQAFRHFWTFAAEPRCIMVRDVETNQLIVSPLTVNLRNGSVIEIVAPALLPDLDTISTINTSSPEYWPVVLKFAADASHLTAFRKHQTIYLRRKSLLAQYRLNPFAIAIATRKSQPAPIYIAADAFTALFTLRAFHRFGITQAHAAALLPRAHSARELPAEYDSDRQDERGDAVAPPVAATLDPRTTGIDDLLVLSGDVHSRRRDRLMGLKLLLTWAETERAAGKAMLWISEESVDALRAEVLMRMGRELAEEDEAGEGSEMVVD